MKFRHLILISVIGLFLTNSAHARYLQMMKQYSYVGAQPTAIQTIHAAPITNASQMNTMRSSMQPVAQFQSTPQIVPQSQYVDGMNLCQYCQSDPVNYVDPLGLECSVVVKRFVSKGTGASSWIDMGHEWLSTNSGSIGFWPNGAGIPGRESRKYPAGL